jgi:predicted nucleic acid-binding Zn ribbon protein
MTPVSCRVCGADCPKSHSNSPRRFCSEKCYHVSKKGRRPPIPLDVAQAAQREATRKAAEKLRGTSQSVQHKEKRLNNAWQTLAETPKTCRKCGEQFLRTTPAQRYCSGRCWLAVHRKQRKREKRFTIPEPLYLQRLAEQNNRCAICDELSGSNNRNDRLAVDHCHSRNVFRGLLCHRCNTALGLFKDSVENLESAIRYLRTHAAPAMP